MLKNKPKYDYKIQVTECQTEISSDHKYILHSKILIHTTLKIMQAGNV